MDKILNNFLELSEKSELETDRKTDNHLCGKSLLYLKVTKVLHTVKWIDFAGVLFSRNLRFSFMNSKRHENIAAYLCHTIPMIGKEHESELTRYFKALYCNMSTV